MMNSEEYRALSPREKYLRNLARADQDGTSRLVLAATFGDLDMVKTLVSSGADLNAGAVNDLGIRLVGAPFPLSVEQLREIEALERLISEELKQQIAQAPPPPTSSNMTALMAASRFGFLDIVNELLNAGAQIERQDFRGVTALFIAAENRHLNIVKVLLERGANPEFVSTQGKTFLHAAVAGGNLDLVNLALRYPNQINARAEFNHTALLTAAHQRRTEIAKLLVERGADVNVADQGGTTPLIASAPNDDNPSPAKAELVQLLIKNGADVNAADNDGWTALLGAAFHGDLEFVKLLTAAGADVAHADGRGRTAKSVAIECERQDVVSFLDSLSQ